MSASFDFSSVRAFSAGTQGPKGHRTFFLQAASDTELVTLQLEKEQVAVLAEYLEGLLETTTLTPSQPAVMGDLIEPVSPQWIIGTLMVAIQEGGDHVVIIAEELQLLAEGQDLESLGPKGSARFALTKGQVEGFIAGAHALVDAGRPLCPLCRLPLESAEHFCPRLN